MWRPRGCGASWFAAMSPFVPPGMRRYGANPLYEIEARIKNVTAAEFDAIFRTLCSSTVR